MCFTCVPAESDVLAGDGSPRMGVRPGGGGKADFCDRPFNVRWRVCAREPEVVQPGGSCVRVHGRWVCFPALGRRRVQHGTLGGTEESDRPDGLAGDRRGERAQCESGAESGGAGMRRVVTAGCWAGLSPGDFRRLPFHAPVHPSFLGAAWCVGIVVPLRPGIEPCVGSSEWCPLATREAPGVVSFLIWNSGCSGSPLRSRVPSRRAGAALAAASVPLVAVVSLDGERGLWARGLQSRQVLGSEHRLSGWGARA